MTAAARCACGSTLDLRTVMVDSVSGPPRPVTVCGPCAPGATLPVPPTVARVLARSAGIRLPGDLPRLHPAEGDRARPHP
ncbi:hypothetical protein [Streptomyces lydicus]|uniref:Uncharacterized protein n=1 Tax=Streptomyces lydicus TaxID=47763 RepID=A0A1D7VFZ7_9ACTN|nr:hypothetical protein [Streptomyces lydicus]AOP45676.1 hypothetical protein SL103_04955 [Streptomyces lydicus]